MAQSTRGQRVDFSPDNLIKEGLRYNIPSPVKQFGPTCWYATTFNMLNYYGLHQDFEKYHEPPDGAQRTKKDWDWLGKFSDEEPTDRETKLMNMVMANKRTNFTLRSLDVSNLTINDTRDKIIELLKAGPVYIAMNKHPSAKSADYWDGAGIGGPLVPGDRDVVYRTTKSVGGGPHAMLLVGYMRRDSEKLYKKVTSNAGGDKPYKVFEEIVADGKTDDEESITMELILLDPNWPGHHGNTNNVILMDWHDIYSYKNEDSQTKIPNLIELMYITENDNETSRAATPQRSTKENSRAATPQRSTKENSRAATPQRSTKENSRAATSQRSTKENSRAATPQRSTKENSRAATPQRSTDSNIRNRGSSTNTKNKNEKKGGCILM